MSAPLTNVAATAEQDGPPGAGRYGRFPSSHGEIPFAGRPPARVETLTTNAGNQPANDLSIGDESVSTISTTRSRYGVGVTARQARGLRRSTIREAADRGGVSIATVSRILAGDYPAAGDTPYRTSNRNSCTRSSSSGSRVSNARTDQPAWAA
jgi:hypothetical protein